MERYWVRAYDLSSKKERDKSTLVVNEGYTHMVSAMMRVHSLDVRLLREVVDEEGIIIRAYDPREFGGAGIGWMTTGAA